MLLYDLLPLFYHNGTHLCIKIWLNCLTDTNVYYIIQTNKVIKVYRNKKGRRTQYGEYDEDVCNSR